MDLATEGDLGNGVVADTEVAEWCHVALVAIGELSHDRDSARLPGPLKVQVGGADLDPLDRRSRWVAPGSLRRSRRE